LLEEKILFGLIENACLRIKEGGKTKLGFLGPAAFLKASRKQGLKLGGRSGVACGVARNAPAPRDQSQFGPRPVYK
jgi:hypothetical protein